MSLPTGSSQFWVCCKSLWRASLKIADGYPSFGFVSSFHFEIDECEFDYRLGCDAGRTQGQISPSTA
jgi:hypothetical protein